MSELDVTVISDDSDGDAQSGDTGSLRDSSLKADERRTSRRKKVRILQGVEDIIVIRLSFFIAIATVSLLGDPLLALIRIISPFKTNPQLLQFR